MQSELAKAQAVVLANEKCAYAGIPPNTYGELKAERNIITTHTPFTPLMKQLIAAAHKNFACIHTPQLS